MQEKPIVHEDALHFLNKVKVIFHTTEPIDYAAMKQKYDDAGDYLGHVEDAFQDCREKYDDLLTILSCYCLQRIDLSMCTSRVREVFRRHPDLLLGFNAFLPKHCEVVLPLVDNRLSHKMPLEPEDASHFIEKAKSCFKKDEQIYNSLINIIGIHSKRKVLWSNDCLQGGD
ncbi:paired amphipathic helix protein Sin3-like 4 [Phoenix dactylifera]|uniref:Paired amphipathic helix protein Sin3-like 4 n=1 Tax=Phoenix dactylifera TaxID=42345 RepID=A0A8B9AAW3_PHODC|nr:paired amphipathic helix protein Sin3-like 4 [Phoenix dactylifera]